MPPQIYNLDQLEIARRRGHLLICICATVVHLVLALASTSSEQWQPAIGVAISFMITLAILNKRISIHMVDSLMLWASNFGAIYMIATSAYFGWGINTREALIFIIFFVVWFGILKFREAVARSAVLYAAILIVSVFNYVHIDKPIDLMALSYVGFLAIIIGQMTATGRQIRRQLSATAHYADLAMTDPLTGVCNRRGMQQHIQQLQQTNKQDIGLLLVDIDHFKQVNDTYGHEVGDHILQHVASVLCRSIRREHQHHASKDIVARWGGEEFLILIRTHDIALLQHIGDRMIANLNDIESPLPKVTLSIGVAQLSEVKESAELIRLVDRRMYQAKEKGRNRMIWQGCA